MRRLPLLLLLLPMLAVPALTGCGDEQASAPAAPQWQHCRIEGLAGAGGLALYRDQLLIVCGADERGVFALPLDVLRHDGRVRARKLDLECDPEAYLMGADRLATQDYRLRHLWDLPMDFQGIAVQPPQFVYLADRLRRIVYWGRITRDAVGRAQHLRLQGCLTVAGAQRVDAASGDWRDKGPGIAGIAATSETGKTEDLYVIDRLVGEEGLLRIHRMNRYGSALGSISVAAGEASGAPFGGLARRRGGFVLAHGAPFGVSTVRDPRSTEDVELGRTTPLPVVPGVSGWTGVAQAEDGTLYAISDSDPAVLAWLAPAPE